MDKLLDAITKELQSAFLKSGYDEKYGKAALSNRPDLCEFQCNGALAAAKEYKKAPAAIAGDVAEALSGSAMFSEVCAVAPGFLNLKLSESFLADHLNRMRSEEKFGLEKPDRVLTVIVDYGGPNVAKPLHVGHLRSAIIGESVKRIGKYMGHNMIGDIHLGDWGLQMGLIITELQERRPDLPYFDPDFQGEYPEKAPFTISELEEIYPAASARSKEDEDYKVRAMEATYRLQQGDRGCRALWRHILSVSMADLKKNYQKLDVDFELWKGESDVQDLIPGMVEYMKKQGYAYLSDGALVVDVKEETDAREIPPCMILKSDGASLYNTTDLATIMQRMEENRPDQMIYVVDKRQELHFEQVFRCARKTKLVGDDMVFKFIGFGTMNGKDGKPFKTREGGVMRLEDLIEAIDSQMYRKIVDNKNAVSGQEAEETARIVALSAVKYGDLSNQASKDYIFDIDRFTSFEGNTGPYILYTIVRIKSILAKYRQDGGNMENLKVRAAGGASEKEMMLIAGRFGEALTDAYEETAPHKVCAYIYELANAFNRFYHETKILTEEDRGRKESFIALLKLVEDILETCIGLLGFSAPERM